MIRSLRFLNVKVMLSTDISSRGLDILNVNLVVNYEIPMNRETYIHRTGRAGRFGTPGIAVTLCTGQEEIGRVQEYSQMAVRELGQFEKELYVPRVLLEGEKVLLESSREQWVDVDDAEAPGGTYVWPIQVGGVEDGWVDVPPEESPEKIYTVPVSLEELREIRCWLCENMQEKSRHCHCRVCKENYEAIARYLPTNM